MSVLENIRHLTDEPMREHTTFRVGGPAKCLFLPKDVKEIKAVIDYCKENKVKYYILGNGSNVLFSDEGFDGYIIQIYSQFNSIDVQDGLIYAQAGALLSRIAMTARNESLTGLEFAAGIPGTLGGAIVMNAGAYDGEMKDVVEYVDILDSGEVKRFTGSEMDFGYRHSIVKGDMVVLGAALRLRPGVQSEIDELMQRLRLARTSKQPLEYPSAGSTFKRPEGYFAGKLIEDSGLKGYRVGDAMVSEKHCGFVINVGNATSKDIVTLIDDVKNTVNEKFGVVLEPEVKIIR